MTDDLDLNDSYLPPLINTPYSYENMVENPIVKPIAETDQSIRDLDEFILKKLEDLKKDQDWVNQSLEDAPEYSDSEFVSRLLRLFTGTKDLIKIYEMQIKKFRECVKEIHSTVIDKYGIKVIRSNYKTETIELKEAKPVIPEGTHKDYLEKLSRSKEKYVSDLAVKLLDSYNAETEASDDLGKFDLAIGRVYKVLKEGLEKEAQRKLSRTMGDIGRMAL